MADPSAPPESLIDAEAVDGDVVLIGDMVSVKMEPEAALESAERIRKAAEQAIKDREQG